MAWMTRLFSLCSSLSKPGKSSHEPYSEIMNDAHPSVIYSGHDLAGSLKYDYAQLDDIWLGSRHTPI